jgi:hypothetical protein
MVPIMVTEIYSEFIDVNATSPVNIDCKVLEITEVNLSNPNRWSFDEAAVSFFVDLEIFEQFLVNFDPEFNRHLPVMFQNFSQLKINCPES